MTREGRKLKLLSLCNGTIERDGTYFVSGSSAEQVVDSIFDYFESINNNSCEGCMYEPMDNEDYWHDLCEHCSRLEPDNYVRKEIRYD